MTLKEFKAWFEGFVEAIDGTPSAAQFERIKDRVAQLDEPKHQFVPREGLSPALGPVVPSVRPTRYRNPADLMLEISECRADVGPHETGHEISDNAKKQYSLP